MVTYRVFKPAVAPLNDLEQVDSFRFIKSGFCWPALFIPILWLLYHRAWYVMLAYVAMVIGMTVFLLITGLTGAGATILTLVLGLYFALEANNLRAFELEHRGYQFCGVTTGKNLYECEKQFFTGWNADAAWSPLDDTNIPGTVADLSTQNLARGAT